MKLGPFFVIVRSGRSDDVPLFTSVVVVVVLVKFCAERVPVTDAVLLRTVPCGASTTPRIVTVHEPPPSIVPAEHVTSVALCVHEPRVLVIWSCGGTPIPPTPLS